MSNGYTTLDPLSTCITLDGSARVAMLLKKGGETKEVQERSSVSLLKYVLTCYYLNKLNNFIMKRVDQGGDRRAKFSFRV